jgi:hypothetical protein
LIEQAFHILRSSPFSILSLYYIGSLPFVLAFLYFWADMSRSPFARSRAVEGSLCLAFLYLWMKMWQAVFLHRLRARLLHADPTPLSAAAILKAAVHQTIFQPYGLLSLPIALVLAFPFGWVYAFYQNLSATAFESDSKSITSKAWKYAKGWPMQNHIILSVMFLFCCFVYVNVCLAILFLPSLLKILTGIETAFTMSPDAVFNSTFLMAAGGITYLLVNPLHKVIYLLRCVYIESLETGADLLAELQTFPVPRAAHSRLTAVVFVLVLLSHTGDAFASGPVKTEEIDQEIEKVLKKGEYQWRFPQERAAAPENAFVAFISNIQKRIKDWLLPLWRRLVRWLRTLQSYGPKAGNLSAPSLGNRILLYSLLGATALFLVFLAWRHKRRKPFLQTAVVAQPLAAVPDLEDEDTDASQLPEEGWYQLAREFMARGDLRMALRALYLASLSHLASSQLITISRSKSNREYLNELRRRALSDPLLFDALAENFALFERAWYGMHEVTEEHFNRFTSNQQRITGLAQI